MSRWLTEEQAAAHEAKMRRQKLRIPIAGETSPAVDLENRAAAEEDRIQQGPASVLLHGAVPYERDIQSAILKLLELHPAVSWAARMNSGSAEFVGKDGQVRFVRFAFAGCSDILGMMVGGRLLAIEVKRPGKDPTPDQLAFLTKVSADGGLAFVARSLDDVSRGLA